VYGVVPCVLAVRRNSEGARVSQHAPGLMTGVTVCQLYLMYGGRTETDRAQCIVFANIIY